MMEGGGWKIIIMVGIRSNWGAETEHYGVGSYLLFVYIKIEKKINYFIWIIIKL